MSGIEAREFDEAFGECLKIAVQQSEKAETCGKHDCSLYRFEESHCVNAADDVLL